MELHRDVAGEARARRSAAAAAEGALRAAAACCTSARASGIPASRCRAGRSACFWRTDGEPLWHDDALVADTQRTGPRDASTARGRSSTRWRSALGLPAGYVITAYEDVPKLLHDESALPVNVDPLAADLSQPGERARLARLLQRGPRQGRRLRAAAEGRRRRGWRGRRVGNEPVAAAARAPLCGRRRFAARLAAAARRRCPRCCRRMSSTSRSSIRSRRSEAPAQARRRCSRTAVARAERQAARSDQDGARRRGARRPSARLRAAAAQARGLRGAARRHRGDGARAGAARASSKAIRRRAIRASRALLVTPDPGVIEVNMHPASTWRELIDTTRALYEEARQTRLAHREVHARRPPHRHRRRQSRDARRRHARGQPAAAPARPAAEPDHLLAEPSGAVVPVLRACSSDRRARRRASTRRATTGSTSSRSPSSSSTAKHQAGKAIEQPWLVDRLLRNLLIDLTGNTHRAEFSIDKLYSPDTRDRAARPARVPRLRDAAACADERRADAAAARAGRALLARRRTAGRLIRWGTALHDRWLLPHFVAADMRDVVDDLRRAGYRVRDRVVRAVRRVPLSALRHGHLRRRHARAAAGDRAVARARRGGRRRRARRATSTRRSSGCRSRSRGMIDERHAVTCNGRARAADADRRARRVRRRRALSRVEPAVRAASDDRRAGAAARSTSSTAGRSARSAAARITSRTRAAATTTRSRSTPTKPRRGASRASGRTAIRPVRSTCTTSRAIRRCRRRSTCAGIPDACRGAPRGRRSCLTAAACSRTYGIRRSRTARRRRLR